MKNYYFSLVLFFTILFSSFTSNMYLQKILADYKNTFSLIVSTENLTNYEIYLFDEISKRFQAQKNMLRLFVSKEHIKDIDTCISLIELHIDENDLQSCKEKSIEIICTVNQISEYMSRID